MVLAARPLASITERVTNPGPGSSITAWRSWLRATIMHRQDEQRRRLVMKALQRATQRSSSAALLLAFSTLHRHMRLALLQQRQMAALPEQKAAQPSETPRHLARPDAAVSTWLAERCPQDRHEGPECRREAGCPRAAARKLANARRADDIALHHIPGLIAPRDCFGLWYRDFDACFGSDDGSPNPLN